DKELLQRIQAIVMRVQSECERLSSVTGSLLQDFQQKQKDIEALFQSLEKLKKDKAEEQYLLLTTDGKADKAALGSKVNCTQFEVRMERLEERMREMLSRVLGQEQRWLDVQRQLCAVMDCKLDRLELGPFQKKLEKTWKSIKELKEGMKKEYDDAAGIRKQLLAPFECLSCDRNLNMRVPGP
ncbi:QRIC2 protein, partial [Menura novaehollandiae]|nr:QRIC2 protein [Menura novaehollandiae]